MNEYERKASVLPRNLESSEGSNGVPQLKLITSGTKTGTTGLNFYLRIGNTVYKYIVHQSCSTPDKITFMIDLFETRNILFIRAVNFAENTAQIHS